MTRDDRFHRSKTGCLQCRRKHHKCDENRPICSFCSLRDLECQYPSGLKWVHQTQPMSSRHRSRRGPRPMNEMAILESSPFIFPSALFHTEEDRHAWEYYVRLVSSNVPALDGPDNPYRQLSFTALTSPILLETIVCIATEHMLNFGLGAVSMAAQRQQQMLRTIGNSLHGIDATGIHMKGSAANAIDHEALLTAVVLQGVVVAQAADGVLEPHVKCASFLMQTLDHFRHVPQSTLARMAVQRFGMVDVMLAISRQRRPYAPRNFILHEPDPERWDNSTPSFRKMTGCPQPLMCFLVSISHLACDVQERLEQAVSINDILAQAHRLESDLRSWGNGFMGSETIAEDIVRPPLDILTECFYWTAHLLLARRVFRDSTRSLRVQHLMHTCFGLMDQLSTGCGPDSSLPQPFYLAAREAITPEDRAWVRQKHESMTEYYREQQRIMAMHLTEKIWEISDEAQVASPISSQPVTALSNGDDRIRVMDQRSRLFIF